MASLIKAEFTRLFKNKVLYILCAASAALGAFLPIVQYLTRDEGEPGSITYADSGCFAIIFFGGFIAAILISLFTGTEYSDGTIRNKLVCGHTRPSVYFSKLVVNFCGMLTVLACFYITFFGFCTPLLKVFQYTAKDILFGVLVGCANFLAYTAIFTAISICKSNKATVAVLCMVMTLILIICAFFVQSRLSEPAYYPPTISVSVDGVLEEIPEEPNPNYLSGTKREVFQFILDFLPSGQAFQSSGFSAEPEMKGEFIIWSLVLTAASTLVGLPVFRKKNIN